MRTAANSKVIVLQILFAQVIIKHLKMKASIILKSLTELP